MRTEAVPTQALTAPPRKSLPSWVFPTAVVGGICGMLLVFFLSIYPVKGFTTPIGWDASEYLWRTRLAQDQGLRQTTHPLPSAARPKSGRPAYVVLAATLSSLGRVDPLRLEMVMGSVLCVVIGLAAGAFVVGPLRRPPWELAVVALVVALSAAVIRLMMPEGYLDTMLSAAVLTIAAAAVILALEDRRAVATAAVLLGIGAIVHWTFFSLMAGAFALLGAVLIPVSWRRWRTGAAGFLDVPTVRIGEIIVGGGLLGAGILFGVLGERLPSPRVDISEFAKKLKRDVPKYHFLITLPAAALGAASLVEGGRRAGRADRGDPPGEGDAAWRYRYVLALLLAWCAIVLAGYLGRRFLNLPIPAHRFLSFGLAIPILVSLGLLWIARRAGRLAPALAVTVVVAGLLTLAFVAHAQWFGAKAFMDRAKVQDAGAAAAYLDAEHIPLSRPFVLIIGSDDWNNVAQIGNTARASVPPDRLASLYLYVGTPEGYLAKRPVDNPVSRSYFQRMQATYAQDPVAFALASFSGTTFDAWVGQHPTTRVAPRLAVLHGPVASVPLVSEAPSTDPIPWWHLGFLAVGALAALFLVGGGWVLVSFSRWFRPIELMAAAPTLGIAAIVVLGSILDRFGLRLTGIVGAAVPVVAGLAGWVAWFGLSRSKRRQAAPA